MRKCKAFALFFAAAALTGCSQTESIPYTGGDPCEWAKQNLIVVQESYNKKFAPNQWDASKIKQSQRTVIATCKEPEKDDDGAWACAEGHSCK